MSTIEAPSNLKQFPIAVIKSMIGLSTSGFGVVVALAWNEFIKQTVEHYVDPYLGKGSGIASLFIYATIMTVLAVSVTMQLTSIQRKLEVLAEDENSAQKEGTETSATQLKTEKEVKRNKDKKKRENK